VRVALDTAAKPIIRVTFAVSILVIAVAFAAIYYRTSDLIDVEIANLVAQEMDALVAVYKEEDFQGLRDEILEREKRVNAARWRYYLEDSHGNRVAGQLRAPPPRQNSNLAFRVISLREFDSVTPMPFGIQEHVFLSDERLVIARDMSIRQKFERSVAQGLISAFVLTIGLSIMTGILLRRMLASRMEVITRTTDAVMQGDLSRRIWAFDQSDEFAALARSLNSMLTRLEGLVISTRVISDLSMHQMRNALTRLRARLETLSHSADNIEKYDLALQTTMKDMDGLLRSLSNLMDIARVEAGLGSEQMTHVDLSQLIEDIGDLYKPFAEEDDIDLETELIGPLTVFGHGELIGQAISNLVENAVKYSGKGTKVTLRAGLHPRGPTVSVIDQGPGIPRDQIDTALKRFVRLEGSGDVPGSGLGLSLVAAVARLHGADFSLQNAHPGLRAVLRFRHPSSIPPTPK
jgi:signal transduction histidine kinase